MLGTGPDSDITPSVNQVERSPIAARSVHTPVAGQPGFVAGTFVPVTYTIASAVPEPSSFVLLAVAAAGGVVAMTNRAKRAKKITVLATGTPPLAVRVVRAGGGGVGFSVPR